MQYLQCLWSRSFLLTTDLATQMQNTPSLGELVRGSAWQIEQIHRCRIRSVPSDAQGFMGLVQIVFPSVQIKRSERAEQKPWSPAAERGLVRDPKRCEDQCVCVWVCLHHADGDGARFLLCGSAGCLGEIGTQTRTETGDLQAEQVNTLTTANKPSLRRIHTLLVEFVSCF